MLTEGIYTYHVYIITNINKTVIYTGMTNYLARRLYEHSQNIVLKDKSFASKYKYLLFYEKFT